MLDLDSWTHTPHTPHSILLLALLLGLSGQYGTRGMWVAWKDDPYRWRPRWETKKKQPRVSGKDAKHPVPQCLVWTVDSSVQRPEDKASAMELSDLIAAELAGS